MGKLLVDLRNLRNDARYEAMKPSERRAMENTLREAEENGAEIKKNGFGGLPPSLALGVYRRDGWRCKACGTSKGLGLHHKGGIKSSKHSWRRKTNNLTNLVVICDVCHGRVHTEDKEQSE